MLTTLFMEPMMFPASFLPRPLARFAMWTPYNGSLVPRTARTGDMCDPRDEYDWSYDADV